MTTEQLTDHGYGYAVLSRTDYYGPSSRYELLQITQHVEQAEQVAATHNPDYDLCMDCCRLAHNQSSPTCGQVAEILWSGDTCPLTDWEMGCLPDSAQDALMARGRELAGEAGSAPTCDEAAEAICQDTEAAAAVLEAHGLIILAGNPEAAEPQEDYYLVRLI